MRPRGHDTGVAPGRGLERRVNDWSDMPLSNEPPRVLVVEDDRDIAALVALHLSDLPAQVERVHDGAEGLRRARSGHFDAMVLDLRLPSLGGLDVCRELRAGGSTLAILMLTA